MKRILSLALLPAALAAREPSPEAPVSVGWVRHRLQLGPHRLAFDTPARLSPQQEFPPMPEEAANLERVRLRRPGEPITEGLTLFSALFDLESPFLGLPQGSLELSIFVGELQNGTDVGDFAAFSKGLQTEFRGLLEQLGRTGQVKVLQDFHPLSLGGRQGLGLRLVQQEVETWHHFLPNSTKVFVDIQFRVLPRPRAEAQDLVHIRTLASRILQSIRFQEQVQPQASKPRN